MFGYLKYTPCRNTWGTKHRLNTVWGLRRNTHVRGWLVTQLGEVFNLYFVLYEASEQGRENREAKSIHEQAGKQRYKEGQNPIH